MLAGWMDGRMNGWMAGCHHSNSPKHEIWLYLLTMFRTILTVLEPGIVSFVMHSNSRTIYEISQKISVFVCEG